MFFRKRPEIRFDVSNLTERSLGDIINHPLLSQIGLDGHIFICGKTRSGKSTLAKVFFAALNGYRIYFNVQRDRSIYAISDVNCATPAELADAIIANKKRINYLPPVDDDSAKIHHDAIYRMAIALGEDIANSRSVAELPKIPLWCTLITDESHIIAPKGSNKDSLSVLISRGLGLGVRSITVTQRPAMISHVPLTQSSHYFIFKVSKFEVSYFKRYGIDIGSGRSFIGAVPHRFMY